MRQITYRLQISISRQDASHIRHDWLGNDGSEFPPLLFQNVLQRLEIIPRRKHYIVEHRRRDALRIRKASGILSRPQLLRGMAMAVQAISVIPTVIVAFEF